MKLVLFGDSLLGQCGRDRIQKLEAKTRGEYDVYNCAAGGWDSNDLVRKAPYIASLNSDVVVISVGTNDASPWRALDLNVYRSNLQQLLTAFNHSKIVFLSNPPVDESKQTPEKPRNNELGVEYNTTAKQVCTEMNVAFIDSWAIFEPMLKKGITYHIEDGVHLNDVAYERVFDEINEKIV